MGNKASIVPGRPDPFQQATDETPLFHFHRLTTALSTYFVGKSRCWEGISEFSETITAFNGIKFSQLTRRKRAECWGRQIFQIRQYLRLSPDERFSPHFKNRQVHDRFIKSELHVCVCSDPGATRPGAFAYGNAGLLTAENARIILGCQRSVHIQAGCYWMDGIGN